jgi:hypothetical protein
MLFWQAFQVTSGILAGLAIPAAICLLVFYLASRD